MVTRSMPRVAFGRPESATTPSTTAPPDELNLIVTGADFGWPQSAGNQEPVVRMRRKRRTLAATRSPVALFPPGSTPTSVAIAPCNGRSCSWRCEHGEVVQVQLTADGDNATGEVSTFLTGLRNPQHLLAWRDGSLLVSDFASGAIYRIIQNGSQ